MIMSMSDEKSTVYTLACDGNHPQNGPKMPNSCKNYDFQKSQRLQKTIPHT